MVKTFGATRALRGVSLDVQRGEVVALLGENGAGKSTLIEALGGLFRADSGQVLIDGVPDRYQVRGGGRAKVAFIHQDLGLIAWMTVAENIGLASRRHIAGPRAGCRTPDHLPTSDKKSATQQIWIENPRGLVNCLSGR